ncbi:MAG: glycosyltransferase family 4 protein [Candidatus Kerfeldbacteria bacterium]|nr:glycosyltransferase family 4 protein [Candidatus Kerfeldbacteria bacterium]
MIIGIDASRANSLTRTGTEWYSYHVIQELKKLIPAEHEVVLYSKEPLRADLADLPAHWRSRVLHWPPKLLWTQFRLSLEMLLHRPDVLYIPAHTIPLIHPKKIALVVHDVGFERQTELYSTKEKAYHRFAMKLAVKYATSIITVSAFSKSEIVDVYHIDPKRITVIFNGLNNYEYDSASIPFSSLEQRLHIRKPYLLFIGRVEQKKNIPFLIDIFAILKTQYHFSGQLILAGSPGFGHDDVMNRIAAHQLKQDVIQTGWIEEHELRTLMQNATLFVFPSAYEGFGIPILEAMQAGIPVVCSAIPALQEVGGEAACYMDIHSSHSAAEKINALLAAPDQMMTLRQKGTERVKQFSWSATAAQTWKTISTLL